MGLFFALISLFFIYNALDKKTSGTNWNVKVVNSFILYSLFIVLTTELLSIFHLLNQEGLITCYILLWCILFFLSPVEIKSFKLKINHFKRIISNYKITFSIVSILLGLLLVQGIVYPPNNWDSLTYHLPRIVHWIQNQSIENYPTNITRQLYSPPLSEFFILHFSLISKNDFYSNSVQLVFLVGAVFATINLLKLYTQNKTIITLGIVLSLTIPEAILEASSTQNDIIHSFFLLASLYYGILLSRKINKQNAIYFGLSSGLCLLSKIIAYLYMPIIFVFVGLTVSINIFKDFKIKHLSLLVSSLFLIISINLPFTLRKIEYSNSISGTSGSVEKGIVFEKFSPSILLSTSIKNIALHFDDHFVGNLGNKLAEKSHLILGIDINEKGTNVFDFEFDALNDWKNHEDSQANFILTLLFFFATSVMIFKLIKQRKLNFSELFLFSIIIVQFLCFCAYIRWEPWNSRVHTPLYFEIVIFSLVVLSNFSFVTKKYFVVPIYLISIFYAFYLITFNYSRPFITTKKLTSTISIFDNRYKKYFANNIKAYKEYKPFYDFIIQKNKPFNVGFISHIDGWEYPIIVAHYYNSNIRVEHLKVENNTKRYFKNFKPDYIFSSYLKNDYVLLKNKKFRRINQKNKYIQLFKKL